MKTFHPLISDKPLIVYIDYKSPYAFVAKDPTYRLEDDLGIEIDWRPLTLDIPSYLGSAKLDEKGRLAESKRSADQWRDVKYAYRDARRYARLNDLTLRGTIKIWDSSLAHIGMLWAKQHSPSVLHAYTGRVYEPFWKRELDIEDIEVIEGLLVSAGATVEGFEAYAAGPGRELHDTMQRRIFNAGIFGVPSYVIDEEIFFGREHLPLIRWRLSGRKGKAPDIAYQHFSGVNRA